MSRYIQILNAIKTNIGHLGLTPSQLACKIRLEEELAYPGVVNLYGLPGVGKTVLGWAMAHSGASVYVVHPYHWNTSHLSQAPIVFIDNVEEDRSSFRHLRATLKPLGIDRFIVASQAPIDDFVSRTELFCTREDMQVVQRNLTSLGYQGSMQGCTNLWLLLAHVARL
jgi:hypothetical protein